MADVVGCLTKTSLPPLSSKPPASNFLVMFTLSYAVKLASLGGEYWLVRASPHNPSLLPAIALAWTCHTTLAPERKEKICLGGEEEGWQEFCDKEMQKEEMLLQVLMG